MGTSWATNSWAASSWAIGTWADLSGILPWVLRHINNRMQHYLRGTLGYTSDNLGANIAQYLKAGPNATARWITLMRLAAHS